MVHDRVDELLRRIRLEGSAHRYPSQLSRGQRQRVALARALATEPKVLLLDAPFAALAAPVRKDLWQWLRRLQDELGITSIFVTHDQEEAFAVADRVIHLKEGRIEPSEASAEDLDPAPCFLPFPGRVTSSRGGRCGLRQRSSSW
jgi:sulfate transport system ATP-binding protein